MLENWAWQLAFVKIGLANTNFYRNVAVTFSPQSDFWRVSKVRINFIKGGEDQCAVEEHEKGEDGRRVDVGVQPADHHLIQPRPFEPSIKSHFFKILITFGNKCPRNGSKNEHGIPPRRAFCGYTAR